MIGLRMTLRCQSNKVANIVKRIILFYSLFKYNIIKCLPACCYFGVKMGLCKYKPNCPSVEW